VADIAVAQAAFAGFGVIRRKPWAPLVWSALYASVLSALVVVLGGAFILALGRLMRATSSHSQPDPAALFSLLGGVFGGYLLLIVVFWVLGAVINMAVVRAVLEPESGAFAYLRLGRAELWLMLANFVLGILYALVSTVIAIPTTILLAMAMVMWPKLAPFVGLPIQLITWVVTIWLGLRFCMVAPMIFTDRKFRLFESWTFTRGRVVRLFQVGLLMAVATIGVYAVLAAAGFAIGAPLVGHIATSMTPQAFFNQTAAQAWNTVYPVVGLYVGLVWLGSLVLFPLFFAPWADAYRQLRGAEIETTFG
jgi:hypothetical protein